jgi:hypothetical protein
MASDIVRSMASGDKVRENRLRRMAERQGLRLVKSRRRDPLAYDYGAYWIAAEDGGVVAGDPKTGMSIDEVEDWLMNPVEERS